MANDLDRGFIRIMKNCIVCIAAVVSVGGVILFGQSAAGSAPGVAAVPVQHMILASHKALYAVTLTSTRPGADYTDVSGKMFLEFNDKCKVWTTAQKSLLKTVSSDGTEEFSNNDFRATESKDGDVYTFSVRQTQNGEVTEYRGSATGNGLNGTGVAEYSAPDHKIYKLPPHFLFQTAQQVRLIDLAQHGGHFLGGDMFDGSEGGGATHFNAVILKSAGKPANPAVRSPLLDSPAHRIRLAFYPPQGDGDADGVGDATTVAEGEEPEYEMTMTLHDNGVVSDYDYDYQDFSVHGQLQAIQSVPRPRC